MKSNVYIQPIGHANTRLIGRTALRISELLPAEILILPIAQIRQDSYDPKRRQYNSLVLLDELTNKMRKDLQPAGKILGVIDEDIFSPIFTFVFGEAQKGRNAALISTKRLRQEFYGMPRNVRLMESRILKGMVHELGHLFGLVHCRLADCVMSKSTNVKSLDQKGCVLCPACAAQIRKVASE